MKRNLKSLLLIVFSVALLFVLTGCANVNYEVKLQKDGSGDVFYIMGYDKNFLNSMQVSIDDLKEDDTFDEMKQEAAEDGYTVEAYEDENTYGFKAFKHVTNIQDEFDLKQGEEQDNANDKINYEKSFLKTKFSQDAKLDLSNVSGDNEEDALTNAIMGQMKISYKIVLPFKVGDNNATTVSEDGKTLEWILKAGQTNEIKFTAEEDNTMYVLGGTGIVVILVILAVIIMVCKKNAKKKEPVEVKTVSPKKQVEKEVKTVDAKKETSKEVKKEEPKKEASKEATKPQEKKETVKKEPTQNKKQEEKKTDNKKEEEK